MKALVSGTILYAVGYLLSRLQIFFILPFILKMLTPGEYGVIEALAVLNLLVTIFTVCNFDTGVTTFYHDQNEEQRKLLVGNGFLMCLLNGSALFFGSLFFSKQLASLVFSSGQYGYELVLGVSGAVLGAMMHFNSVVIRLNGKPRQYNYVLVFNTLVITVVSIFLVNILQYGVRGYLWGIVIGNTFTLLLSTYLLWNQLAWGKGIYWGKKYWAVALPMLPVALAGWSLTIVDRNLLVHYRSLSEVGIYGFASKMASIASILWGPFLLAWTPFAMAEWKSGNPKINFPKVLNYFFVFGGLVTVSVAFLNPILVKIFFPASYEHAAKYVGVLVICNFFNIAYYFPYTTLMHAKKLKYVSYGFVVGALINFLINLYMIPRWGIMGAVVANFVGYFCMLSIITVFGNRFYDLPYDYKIYSVLVVVLSVITFSAIEVVPNGEAASLLGFIGGIALYLGACRILGLFRFKETILLIRDFWPKLTRKSE